MGSSPPSCCFAFFFLLISHLKCTRGPLIPPRFLLPPIIKNSSNHQTIHSNPFYFSGESSPNKPANTGKLPTAQSPQRKTTAHQVRVSMELNLFASVYQEDQAWRNSATKHGLGGIGLSQLKDTLGAQRSKERGLLYEAWLGKKRGSKGITGWWVGAYCFKNLFYCGIIFFNFFFCVWGEWAVWLMGT